MREILFVFLVLSLFIGGFILQVEIGAYDNSGWNFTGAGIARVIFDYSGAFVVLAGIVLFLKGRDKE